MVNRIYGSRPRGEGVARPNAIFLPKSTKIFPTVGHTPVLFLHSGITVSGRIKSLSACEYYSQALTSSQLGGLCCSSREEELQHLGSQVRQSAGQHRQITSDGGDRPVKLSHYHSR